MSRTIKPERGNRQLLPGREEKLSRTLGGQIRAVEGTEDSRLVELSFSSEEPYERLFGPEILDHAEGAVNLSRLNEIGTVLFNHDRDRVIGRIASAGIKDGRGVATIEFDRDEASETIYQKVKSGSLKGVSVGYLVSEWEEVKKGKTSKDGRFAGACFVARSWMPYEISIVSVPADATVGVGRSICRYLIPWLEEKVGSERSQAIKSEAEKLVLAVQQMYPEETGAERLMIVTAKLKAFLESKNLALTEEQMRDFIEAAVKSMKIAQAQGG